MSAIRIPAVPSSPAQIDAALERLALGPDDVLLDLGCGDGRVLAAAVERTLCRAVGIDLDAAVCARARTALVEIGCHWGWIVCGDIADLEPRPRGRRRQRWRSIERMAPTAVYCHCGQAHWARIEAIAASFPTVRRTEIGAISARSR